MESRECLFETIAKVGCDRREYFEALFKYIPEAVVKEMIYEEVHKNEVLLSVGAPNDAVLFVLKGHVIGLDYRRTGYVYSFMDFTKMNVLGDFEAFGDVSEYGTTICAAEDCKLLKLSTNIFLEWVRHDENALFLRLNNIINTLMFERTLDREYIFRGCKERLMVYLVKLYEKQSDMSESLKVRKTQAELADKVGFHLRSVQRSVAALAKDGFITLSNGKIVISKEQYKKLVKSVAEKKGVRNEKI